MGSDENQLLSGMQELDQYRYNVIILYSWNEAIIGPWRSNRSSLNTRDYNFHAGEQHA